MFEIRLLLICFSNSVSPWLPVMHRLRIKALVFGKSAQQRRGIPRDVRSVSSNFIPLWVCKWFELIGIELASSVESNCCLTVLTKSTILVIDWNFKCFSCSPIDNTQRVVCTSNWLRCKRFFKIKTKTKLRSFWNAALITTIFQKVVVVKFNVNCDSCWTLLCPIRQCHRCVWIAVVSQIDFKSSKIVVFRTSAFPLVNTTYSIFWYSLQLADRH